MTRESRERRIGRVCACVCEGACVHNFLRLSIFSTLTLPVESDWRLKWACAVYDKGVTWTLQWSTGFSIVLRKAHQQIRFLASLCV